MTGCKFDRCEEDESIQCIICNIWYHSQCVDVYQNQITFNCPECRVRPQTLKKLVKEVADLRHVYGEELFTIKSKLADKKDEYEKHEVGNISVRNQVASLKEAVKARKWVDFKQHAPAPKTLFIGNLSISNIDESKLYNCHIEWYPNEGVDTVNQTLSKYHPDQVMEKNGACCRN